MKPFLKRMKKWKMLNHWTSSQNWNKNLESFCPDWVATITRRKTLTIARQVRKSCHNPSCLSSSPCSSNSRVVCVHRQDPWAMYPPAYRSRRAPLPNLPSCRRTLALQCIRATTEWPGTWLLVKHRFILRPETVHWHHLWAPTSLNNCWPSMARTKLCPCRERQPSPKANKQVIWRCRLSLEGLAKRCYPLMASWLFPSPLAMCAPRKTKASRGTQVQW